MASTVKNLLGSTRISKQTSDVKKEMTKENQEKKSKNKQKRIEKKKEEDYEMINDKNDEIEDFDFIEQYSETVDSSSKSLLEENTAKSAINCGFVGVGAGGCRIARAFLDIGFNKTILVNSTNKDFDEDIDDKNKVIIPGADGIAKDIVRGKKVLSDNGAFVEDALRTRLGKVDWLFVCAGGGGGTGSAIHSLSRVFERHLAASGASGGVVYIVSSPTSQEKLNETIRLNSESLLSDISNEVHVVIDNEKQFNVFRNKTGLRGMFGKANNAFAKMFWQVLKLASETSPIQAFDGQDLSRFLSSKGRMIIGHSIAEPSADMGNKIYSNCLQTTPCLVADGKPATGALLHVVPNSMADDPDLVMHLDAAASYLGSRTKTLFRGIYIRNNTSKLVTILAMSGINQDA